MNSPKFGSCSLQRCCGPRQKLSTRSSTKSFSSGRTVGENDALVTDEDDQGVDHLRKDLNYQIGLESAAPMREQLHQGPPQVRQATNPVRFGEVHWQPMR